MYPRNTKILVCDDSKICRQIVVKALNERGYIIVDETDCAEGVVELLFENNTRHYDLILLDISMPGMLGTDLVEKIRKSNTKFKDISIIMISAEAEKKTVLKALVNGANDYILKPLDKKTLFDKMEIVWGKLPEDIKSNVILRAQS